MKRKTLLFLILNLILSLSFVHLTGCSFLKKVASKPGEWLGFKGSGEGEEDEFDEDEEDEDGEEGDEMSSEEDSDEDSIFGEATEGEEGDPLGVEGQTEDGESSGEMAESSSPEGEGQGDIDGLASGGSAQSGEGDSYDDSSNRREASYPSNQKKSWIPVKKIATQPFKKNGYLVNAVYLVRSGDTLEDISQKIFQTNKVDELLKINSHFKNKTIRSGDKVYYNSPLRPDDNKKLLIYYEDIGLTPNLYISSEGDNIRKVSKRLLKDTHGWKEVWATNPSVESKTVIPAGIQLRYWGGVNDGLAENNKSSTSTGNSDQLAINNMQPNEGESLPDEGQSVSSNVVDGANSPSVPGADPLGPSNDDKMQMPEGETSTDQGQLAENAANANSDFNYPPPPEEDPQAFEPPPPPQPAATALSSNQRGKLSLLNNDKKLTYGIIGVGASLVILLLLLVARKKKRKKIIDFTDPSSF